MTETSAIDLVERLTRKVQRLPAMGGGSIGLDANGKTTVTSYITDDGYRLVNPDGPEAADTITRLQAALKPFGDVDGEGDEDFPDDTPVVVKFGRSTFHALKLGDFRRASAALSSVGGE